MKGKQKTPLKSHVKVTRKQKDAFKAIIDNRGISTGKAMREAGYSEVSIKNPTNLTESQGFRYLCEHYLPNDLLLESLQDDIIAKKGNRKGELELAFKVKGLLKDTIIDVKDLTINFDTAFKQ